MTGKWFVLFCVVFSVAFFGCCFGGEVVCMDGHPVTDIGDGWRLGVQVYTFKNFTFFEAVDKAASVGLNWIEAYPGQVMNAEKADVRIGDSLSKSDREAIKAKLKDAGVKLINYGVVRLDNDEKQCRKVFDFASDMGVETITAEPAEDAFGLLDELCEEYGINVAIHNHPKTANYNYWNPDYVLSILEKHSKRIGACADVGHWMRSGVQPLEAIRKLEGHIISLHFKDLGEFGKVEAHDVPWGSGKADVKALLAELKRQGFRGVFSIEYEYNWDNSLPDIRECVDYFNRVSRAINPSGWKPLFANDLSNAVFVPGGWVYADGVINAAGDGDIWTVEEYGDFVLDLEFKMDEGTNSGIFLRTGDIVEWLDTAIEVQVLDRPVGDYEAKHRCGAIFDCLSPRVHAEKPADEWNRCTITCMANKICVVLNGEKIIDMNLDEWTEAGRNPDGSRNKFKTAYKDMPRVGHIGLQYHGTPIWYRNVVIKEL